MPEKPLTTSFPLLAALAPAKARRVEAKLEKIAKVEGLLSALERSYFPSPLPKLYIVAKHHSLYALDCLVIVGEVHMNRVSELSVAIKDVGSVAGHDRASLLQKRTILLS
jgi:polysaccharide pyruvyl transferase WcaK-like protein